MTAGWHAGRIAGALRSRGMRCRGDVVILMENNRAYLETAWSGQRSRVSYTAINLHPHPRKGDRYSTTAALQP